MKRNRKNKIQNKLMSVKFGKQYKKMFKRKKLIHKIIKRTNRIKTSRRDTGNECVIEEQNENRLIEEINIQGNDDRRINRKRLHDKKLCDRMKMDEGRLKINKNKTSRRDTVTLCDRMNMNEVKR